MYMKAQKHACFLHLELTFTPHYIIMDKGLVSSHMSHDCHMDSLTCHMTHTLIVKFIYYHSCIQVREAYAKWWRVKVNNSDFLSRRFNKSTPSTTMVSLSLGMRLYVSLPVA